MPNDDVDEPLIQQEGKFSRFIRWVQGMTKAGQKGKQIYDKAKNYSVATQSKGERAFATFAKGCAYLDKAAWAFPPAKAFTTPFAFASGKVNNMIQLRSLLNTNAGKWGEAVPITLESDLLKLREHLAAELNVNSGSDAWTDPEENEVIKAVDGLIAWVQQREEG